MDVTATLTHAGNGKFDAATASGHTVRVQGGEKETGPSPMELVLAALGSCSAVTVVALLRKMRQPFTSFEVQVSGERAAEHPRVYTKIHMRYRVGGDVDHGRVERAIDLTQSKYCSVHTMLEKTAAMSHNIEFI